MKDKTIYPVTPDGRYFVVRGRLWRCSDPSLLPEARQGFVKQLMEARRAKGEAMRKKDEGGRVEAMRRVEEAKRQLGERGPVWWKDGSPDWNQHMAMNTPYADWFSRLESELTAKK